jgi:hypothetical protein
MHVKLEPAPVRHAKKANGLFCIRETFPQFLQLRLTFNTTLDAAQYSRDYGAQIFVPQVFLVAVTNPS